MALSSNSAPASNSKQTLILTITVAVIIAAVGWTVYRIWPTPTQSVGPENPALALQGTIGANVRPIEQQTVNVFYETSADGKTLNITGKMPTPQLLAQLKQIVDEASAADTANPKVVVNFNVTVGR